MDGVCGGRESVDVEWGGVGAGVDEFKFPYRIDCTGVCCPQEVDFCTFQNLFLS